MRFALNERGQGIFEYALILILVAVVVIAILALFGLEISKMFNTVLEQF